MHAFATSCKEVISYGPSETTDYLACPTYHRYRWGTDSGRSPVWTPRELTQKDFSAMVGAAIHAGLAVRWQNASTPVAVALAPAQVGVDALNRQLQQAQLNGQHWRIDPPSPSLVTEGLHRYFAWEPAWLTDQTVCLVEQTLGPVGGTPDLVVQQNGVATVVDFKTLWLRDLRYLPERLQAYHTSWQFHDYCWRVGAHVGRPVTRVLVIGFVYQLIKERGEPDRWEVRSIVNEPVTVSTDAQQRWVEYARTQWADMAGGHTPPGRDLTRCANMGYNAPCDYYEACHGAGMNDVTYTRVIQQHVTRRRFHASSD